MNESLTLIMIALVLMCQASFIFIDAKKRGEKHYFIWGLFGLLQIPSSLIIYLIVTRMMFKRVECKGCHRIIKASDDFKYCPYCREELKK